MKRKTIAVTGGIGSGKSQVRRILAEAGYNVLDCDNIAARVARLPEVVARVRALLGDKAVLDDGNLNRPYIRQTVFVDPDLTSRYTEIFSRAIKDELDRHLASFDGTTFVEVSVPDAFDYPWDEVWLVSADRNRRIDRVMLRDGTDKQNVLDIMARQTADKYPADVLIVNDGTLDSLKAKVLQAAQRATK